MPVDRATCTHPRVGEEISDRDLGGKGKLVCARCGAPLVYVAVEELGRLRAVEKMYDGLGIFSEAEKAEKVAEQTQ